MRRRAIICFAYLLSSPMVWIQGDLLALMRCGRRGRWLIYHPLQCPVSSVSMPEPHTRPDVLLISLSPVLMKQSPLLLGWRQHPIPNKTNKKQRMLFQSHNSRLLFSTFSGCRVRITKTRP